MKNINNRQINVDPIAEARKNKKFSSYSKSARIAIRLAVEIYKKRTEKKWSQTKLAEEIGTTQKVISKIESGDVNIGIDLLKRLIDGLTLTDDDLANIFDTFRTITTSDFVNKEAGTEWLEGNQKYNSQNHLVSSISLKQ